LLGRCPFHEDATASLVVTPGKNLWHCFLTLPRFDVHQPTRP